MASKRVVLAIFQDEPAADAAVASLKSTGSPVATPSACS